MPRSAFQIMLAIFVSVAAMRVILNSMPPVTTSLSLALAPPIPAVRRTIPVEVFKQASGA